MLDQLDDELLIAFGKELVSGRSPGFSPDPEELLHIAKKWLSDKSEQIQSAVCSSERIRKAATIGNSVDIMSALTDLLIGIFGGIPGAALATLVFKAGLESYCKTTWQKRPEENAG